MTDHDESLLDKVKNAFGMGADDEESTVTNRPAGPDYGADETIDSEFGVGLDREGMAGTGANNTGTGLDYDFDRGAVTDSDSEEDEVETERRELGI